MQLDNPSANSFGQMIENGNDDGFVGRLFELHLFDEYVRRLREKNERILNVYGTGGMGKSCLLRQFEKRTLGTGGLFIRIDLQDYFNDPSLVCDRMSRQFAAYTGTDPAQLDTDSFLQALNGRAARQRVVLAFDHYEKAGEFDRWLRETLLPRLSADLIIVIAGRFPLGGPWRQSPGLRRLIVSLPVKELDYSDVRSFAAWIGISDERTTDGIWTATHGHPLTLSLLAQSLSDNGTRDLTNRLYEETFEELLDHWLEELPGEEVRQLLYAAAVPRSFHQELLGRLTGAAIPDSLFDRLVRLSFVARSEQGWQLHDIVRESVLSSFRRRLPDTYSGYLRQWIELLENRVRGLSESDPNVPQAFAELLSATGNETLRAHFRHAKTSCHYSETIEERSLQEAEDYLEKRRRHAGAWTVRCADPETGRLFRYTFTAEQSVMRIRHLDIRAMLRIDPRAVKLLRSSDGQMTGMTAALPIHQGSVDYLRSSPLSRAYFAALRPAELDAMRVSPDRPAGLFLFAIDVANLEDERLRSDSVRQMIELILAGNRIITSPPPHPFYKDGHAALGFEPLQAAVHCDYDGATPTPTYMLDTRQDKLQSLLTRLLKLSGNDAAKSARRLISGLTPRESEVAELLALGHTNAEIAHKLFVSEAAVKKHVNALLAKFQLKNRTQLTKALLERRWKE